MKAEHVLIVATVLIVEAIVNVWRSHSSFAKRFQFPTFWHPPVAFEQSIRRQALVRRLTLAVGIAIAIASLQLSTTTVTREDFRFVNLVVIFGGSIGVMLANLFMLTFSTSCLDLSQTQPLQLLTKQITGPSTFDALGGSILTGVGIVLLGAVVSKLRRGSLRATNQTFWAEHVRLITALSMVLGVLAALTLTLFVRNSVRSNEIDQTGEARLLRYTFNSNLATTNLQAAFLCVSVVLFGNTPLWACVAVTGFRSVSQRAARHFGLTPMTDRPLSWLFPDSGWYGDATGNIRRWEDQRWTNEVWNPRDGAPSAWYWTTAGMRWWDGTAWTSFP